MKGAYLKAQEAAANVCIMEPLARNVLDFIAMMDANKRSLRVTTVVAQFNLIATAPTIFSRLVDLEEDGWIHYRADPGDGRVRLVRPTDKARGLYAKIDRAIERAMADA